MLAERMKIVPVLADGDLSAGANLDTDSINMKNFHKATFLVQLQTIGGADSHLYLYSGATDGACTSSLTFRYAFGSAAQGSANCDVLGAWTSAEGPIHLTHGTYDNYLLVVEVDAAAMDLANEEFWLTMRFIDTDTGATGNVAVIALLEPRFKGNCSVTALA